MFSEKDIIQIENKGISIDKVKNQIQLFNRGLPFINLKESATIHHGITKVTNEEKQHFNELLEVHPGLFVLRPNGKLDRQSMQQLTELLVERIVETNLTVTLFDLTDMLTVGEQTGDMKSALIHIARRYETELDRNVKIFTTALEPILIVLVAATVGFVAVAILMAVSNLTSSLGM